MTVIELIQLGLGEIGVQRTGYTNVDSDDFKTNLKYFQRLCDSTRNDYPFTSTVIYSSNELSNIAFVSIDSMVSSSDENCITPRFYMRPMSSQEYAAITFVKNLSGIPNQYYFQKPNKLFVYPQQDGWYFEVTGKINLVTGITATTDLSLIGIPDFYQDYLLLAFAERVCPKYTTSMTPELKKCLADAKDRLERSYSTLINVVQANDGGIRFRPKYLLNNYPGQ
jgi:hypothetical protein